MLIIPIKDGENIDKALKRFKRKSNTKIVVPRGRNINNPVRKEFLNFLDMDDKPKLTSSR